MTMSAVVPVMIALIVISGLLKKINVYQAFTEGVRNGFGSVISVFPALLAIFVGVGMFRTSGLDRMLTELLAPVAEFFHFPTELVPFAILRPVSGSGALALASDLFSQYGPDSFIGKTASVMMVVPTVCLCSTVPIEPGALPADSYSFKICPRTIWMIWSKPGNSYVTETITPFSYSTILSQMCCLN